jgi:recombinational DNA repair protein (RecF pathway)
LEQDMIGRPIVADRLYTYDVHSGASPCTGEHVGSCRGKTLIALRTGSFGDEATLRQARQVMRRIIDFHLCGRPLLSRELFR